MYHIEKNTVQETLIIPLYGRKVCSEHFPGLFKDPEAERICGMLDYDFGVFYYLAIYQLVVDIFKFPRFFFPGLLMALA